MTWTEKDIPDLTGRTAVVTGANGGLGFQTAMALAGAGAHVVMAARDPSKTSAAVARIAERYPAASLEVVPLDLGDLSVVSAAASKILAGHERVDILVNNAGVMAMPQRETIDGFEMQFGVNHLGHWALTAHLMPALLAAPAARVVTVTSTARHRAKRLDPADPHMRQNYGAWASYARSKMANLHFALGLQQQFEGAGVAASSLAAHPGLTNTDLQARSVREGGAGWLGAFFEAMTARSGMTPFEGARPQLRAATDPDVQGGQYYGPSGFRELVGHPVLVQSNKKSHDVAVQERLWSVSEELTGVKFGV